MIPMKSLTKNQRSKALRNSKPYTNPYLFDVRRDKEIRNLLEEAATDGTTVDLPAGVYWMSYTPAIDRVQSANAWYALVSPKGRVKLRDSGMPSNHNDWLKCVKRWVGIA
jgi:hypothetical protein